MLKHFPGHWGPRDVYQYPISNLKCQTFSNVIFSVFQAATMEAPAERTKAIPLSNYCADTRLQHDVCVIR